MCFCCYNRGNADFILSSSTAKGGSSQCKILSFAAKREWPDESICLSSRTVPHRRNWYSQLLYHQCSSGKRFQNKSKGELFPFLLRSWSNPGLKLWSFSYSVFLKWVKIGKNCLPVLLSAFFFKLSAALAVLYCAGIKLLLEVKLLFRVDTCTRRFILWYLIFSIYICGRVLLVSVFDNSVWIFWL